MNLGLITIDALRYDTASQAETPFLHQLMSLYQSAGAEGWVKVGAHATFTLPAHISMFHAGILPSMNQDGIPAPYNRKKKKLFRAQLKWTRNNTAVYPTPEAPNIIKGFSAMGYRTIGIGGVHWFNTGFATSSSLWENYFDEFYWQPEFAEENPCGLESQIELSRRLLRGEQADSRPVFYFLNISSTHYPYRGNEVSVGGQMKALEYVDAQLRALLDVLPRPLHLLILADHGECFGEDGLWEHTCYHPKVMEIPMISLEIP